MVAPGLRAGESLWEWYQRGPYEFVTSHWFWNQKTRRLQEIKWPSRVQPNSWRGLRPAEDVQ
jgi:hypothetical protein